MPTQKELDRARAAGYKAAQSLNKEQVIDYMLSHKCEEVYKWCGVSELAFRFVKEALGIDGKEVKSIKNRIGVKQANLVNQKLYKVRKQNLINKVPKEDLIDYKSSHTIDETVKHFNIKRDDYDKLLSYYGCTYLTSEKFDDAVGRINKDEFIAYYKSHSSTQTKNEFNLSDGHYSRLIKLWQLSKTSKEVGNIIRNTMLDKYGVTNPNFIPGTEEKRKSTWMSKYGVDHPMRSEDIKQKCEEYFLQTYGVSSPCMLNKCADASRVKISKPNLLIAETLKSFGLDVELEYPLKGYSFDIKVGNTLIEVDPYAFHNVTWHPFNNPLPRGYHLNKSRVGWDNGYNVIHVFDWDNIDDIVNLLVNPECKIIDSDTIEVDNSKADFTFLKKSEFEIVKQIEPQPHYYNDKTREHLINPTRSREEIIDEGFVEIYDCGKTVWRKIKDGNKE